MNNKQENHSKLSIIFPLAVIAAVLGGVGSAVLSHPKQKKVSASLATVADDVVDVLDRALQKIDQLEKEGKKSIKEPADFVTHFVDEVRALHNAARNEASDVSPVSRIEHALSDTVFKVEETVKTTEDDITKKISWLQKKGRALARRSGVNRE